MSDSTNHATEEQQTASAGENSVSRPDTNATPEAPQLKISHFASIVVILVLHKYDVAEMGYTRWVEVGYVVAQLYTLAILLWMYKKIQLLSTSEERVFVPEVKQWGKVTSPARHMSFRAYDMSQLMEQVKQVVLGFVILIGIYYKWRTILPLVLQMVMTPLKAMESPLFMIHIRNITVKRPFPTENAFGLPSQPAPEPAGDAAPTTPSDEDKKEK